MTATGAPLARHGHTLSYDSRRSQLVLFGGDDHGTAPFGDTWFFTFVGEACANGVDDDLDGEADCADLDCAQHEVCRP